MEPFWSHDIATLYTGNVTEVLDSMAAGSVQTVVTSPPYW